MSVRSSAAAPCSSSTPIARSFRSSEKCAHPGSPTYSSPLWATLPPSRGGRAVDHVHHRLNCDTRLFARAAGGRPPDFAGIAVACAPRVLVAAERALGEPLDLHRAADRRGGVPLRVQH